MNDVKIVASVRYHFLLYSHFTFHLICFNLAVGVVCTVLCISQAPQCRGIRTYQLCMRLTLLL